MHLRINIAQKIGKGYKTFWNYKGRYKVCKGSRASKKSTTTAMWIIYHMMKYPLANTLVVRQTYNTHLDSTWVQLKWAAHHLGVADLWHFGKSPLQVTYKPTGQKILFRGLDDPMSITSITVEKGCLCWCWFEEAYQVKSEDSFNKVDMSIRGEMPKGYFKQIIVTFNPWSDKHWLKKRFFDVADEDVLTMTTNHLCNEWLGEDDLQLFEKMKQRYPKRYKVEGLGEWGVAEGLIFENWRVEAFDKNAEMFRKMRLINGGDFGYTNDPTSLISSYADLENMKLYVFNEHYKTGMLNNDIANVIKYLKLNKSEWVFDSAEPKSIEELRRFGIVRAKEAYKPGGSILTGIQRLQQFEIIVHPSCENLIIELENYAWDKDKDGTGINKPIDDFNHAIDALRYSVQLLDRGKAQILSRDSLGF